MRQGGAELLDRDRFRRAVLFRDWVCVRCRNSSSRLDAHHIMDRKLFEDGGYYVDNGVSLCPGCHLAAEKSEVLPHELREMAKIARVVLPPQLDPNRRYDKWGAVVIDPMQERARAMEVAERYFDVDIQDQESAYCVLADNGIDHKIAAEFAAEMYPEEVVLE